jgi:hypothetical protein
MSGTIPGRHRLGTPGLIPVRSLVRVRRRVFGWLRPGRHRAAAGAARAPRLVPAAA